MSNTPSKAEIEVLAQQHLKAFVQFSLGEVWFEGEVEFASAVLARWGTPQPVVREPMTDEQLAEMMRDTWGCASIAPRHAPEFARAVERAHGITQKGGSNAEILAQSVGVSVSTHPETCSKRLKPNEEARRLTPLQAMVAAHYQGGEFAHIETQDDAQNVGDGLFTFCVNEAGDAGDKAEFIDMLNRAIVQLRSLVGELRDTVEVPEELL